MAFDKETAKTANKFYTNGKGMYMLLFDTYSVITSGNSEGPTDDVYLKAASGNPVGAEWRDAVTNESVSLTVLAGAVPIPFTGLVKSPEGAISIDKGSSIELSVQPQPADTTDSITYNWNVDNTYLSYSLNNNKCIITGVAAGSTTVTVTPVVNGIVDASKAVSFATTVNVVVPTLTVSDPITPVQSWQATVAISPVNLMTLCGISTSDGSTPKFTSSYVPAGLTLSSTGILSGTPSSSTAANAFQVTVCIPGFEEETTKYISVNYAIAEAPVQSVVTANDVILDEMTVGQAVEINIAELSNASENTGRPLVFSASGVPDGLSMNVKNGFLIGTPTTEASGNFSVHVYVVTDPAISKDIIVSYNIKAASGGGTSNADYIVSGAVSVPEVNGEYVQDGTLNDSPKYVNTSNSNAIIRFDSLVGWSVFYMGQPKYTTMDTTSATPPVSATWKYGSETVTVVKGNSSGGNESSTPADYIVSGAGTEAVNGNYYATGEYYEGRNSAPIYKNKNGVYFFATGSHNIFANSITTDLNIETYYHCEAYGDYYTTGAWANDALYPTCGEFGIEPFPTVTKA